MESVVDLEEVSFSAQDRYIVQDISVSFEAGKATALVGPSGCGKSTVLKLAAGLLVPDHGEVFYKGKNIAYMSKNENLEFRREAAFVFQDSALWANQNLSQILELPLRIHYPDMDGSDRDKRIKDVTAEVGYKKDLNIRPSRLSMGEQKLIAFSRAMLCDPTLLFLDEWTESLDETAAIRLINIVKKKVKNGATVIFICHDMRIIKDMADVVIMIVDGKISFKTTKDEIQKDADVINYLKTEIAS